MRAGDVIASRFEVERFVARGGMGSVYRAFDRLTGGPVAMKVVLEPERTALERFAREALVLRPVSHPALVRYVAHDIADDGHV